MGKVIWDLCGGTGAWSKPYKDAGYDVRNITLPEYDVIQFANELEEYGWFWGDNEAIECDEVYGILAAPPCTMFSLARTRAKTPRDFRIGMETVTACLRIIWACRYQPLYAKDGALKFWALENPMGFLRQFLGKPALTFDPCDYGDPYTKKTDLWGYFNTPKKQPVLIDVETQLRLNPNTRKLPSISEFTGSKQVAKRSITPAGFAKAFFEANP